MTILRPSLDMGMHMFTRVMVTPMSTMVTHMVDTDTVMVDMVIVMDLRESPQQRRELNTAPSFMPTGMMMKRMVVVECPQYGSMQ